MIGIPVLPPGSQMTAPMGPMPPQPPQMMPNPAYAQWMQAKQAHDAETEKRKQQFLSACQLISSDAAKRYKIDIEADSTIAADEQAEKQSRTEFLQAITPFLEVVVPQIMANPALAPLGKELGMFAVRGFRVSRQLEDAFETAFDNLVQASKNPQQPQGGKNTKSPAEIAAETQIEQTKAHVAMAGVQADTQDAQLKAQAAQQANAVKLAAEQSAAAIEQAKLQQQREKDAAEFAMRGREMEGREALEQARMSHMVNRDTKGLV